MKKRILLLFILFTSLKVFSVENTYLDLNKSEKSIYSWNNKSDLNYYIKTKDTNVDLTAQLIINCYNNYEKVYCENKLELLDSDKIFDINDNTNPKNCQFIFIPNYYLDVLKQKQYDLIFKYQNQWKDIKQNYSNFYAENSELEDGFMPERILLDNLFVLVNFSDPYLINKIIAKDNCFEIMMYRDLSNRNTGTLLPDFDLFKKYINYEELKIFLEFDGDYVDIWINSKNEYLGKFFYGNYKTLSELYHLAKNGNCDLTKVYWPRHADGTSDFDDEIQAPIVKLAAPGHKSINDFPEVLEERKRLEEEKKLEEQKRIEEENYVPTPEEQYELERQAAEDNVDNFDDFMEYNKKYDYEEYKKNLPKYIGYLFLTRILPVLAVLLIIILVVIKIKKKSKK